MLSTARRPLIRQVRHYVLRSRCARYTEAKRTCRRFTVLALESSADDTCAAVVTSEREILSNVVIGQLAKHEVYGGIEPFVAIQEHQRNMPIAVRRALSEARLTMSQIDGVAFTRGPGMSGCLSVCANAAKTLAAASGKPLIGVHHMQAHALTPLLTSPQKSTPTFPFLTLLISGGHTLLLLALSPSKFRVLATTPDEAVGRTIDKVARALGLGWGGVAPGAALERFCRDGIEGVREEEVPRIEPFRVPFRGEMKFSFSGLHSSVDRYILEHGVPSPPVDDQDQLPLEETPTSNSDSQAGTPGKRKPHLRLSDPHRLGLARAFQFLAVAQLEEKVLLALRWCAENGHQLISEENVNNSISDYDSNTSRRMNLPVRHVVVSGGVASNSFFRGRLRACLAENFPNEDLSLVFPPPSLCTDNAAMIAWASMHRFLAGQSDDYSIDHRAKWDIEDLDDS